MEEEEAWARGTRPELGRALVGGGDSDGVNCVLNSLAQLSKGCLWVAVAVVEDHTTPECGLVLRRAWDDKVGLVGQARAQVLGVAVVVDGSPILALKQLDQRVGDHRQRAIELLARDEEGHEWGDHPAPSPNVTGGREAMGRALKDHVKDGQDVLDHGNGECRQVAHAVGNVDIQAMRRRRLEQGDYAVLEEVDTLPGHISEW